MKRILPCLLLLAAGAVRAGLVSQFTFARDNLLEAKVGANAKEVLNTVAMPLEDEVNGVDDMLYMTGQCGDDGSYSLNVSFEVESDRDMDQVKVENRVAQAEA